MERAIVLLTVIAALGGCTVNSGDGGMLILKNVRGDAMCNFTVAETESGVSEGALDPRVSDTYQFVAQLKSRITALTGQEDQRRIALRDAKVDLTFPGSTLFSATDLADLKMRGLTHYQENFSGSLPPNGSLLDFGFVLLPPATVIELSTRMTSGNVRTLEVDATFIIEGDMGGGNVTSDPFTFPITVGNVAANSLGTCPLAKGTIVRTGYACNPGQDGIVDCCTMGGHLVCPATVSTM